jgi:dTDP-4-dehydrorhamnose reductase
LIVVTGASGLLGSNLVLCAKQHGADVVAVYRRHKFASREIRSVRVNLLDKAAAHDTLQTFHPHWVVHCAALTNVEWCEEHPTDAYQVNVEMSRNLAAAAKRIGAALVYISTDSVFDGKRGNYSEADVPAPVNVYGRSKLMGEEAVREELERTLIIRTNIYGWNMQEKQSLAEWIFNRLRSNNRVTGFYDVLFSPLLVNDLSEMIMNMIELDMTGLYHVAASNSCSKYEFALMLAEVFGLEKKLVQKVSIEDSTLKAPRPRITSLGTDKISQVLGMPMPDVRAGLQRFKRISESGFLNKLKAQKGG